MANIKEITVSTKRTLGLPGYSSIGKEAFVTLTLDEGENYEKVYKHAWELVNEQVKEQLREYIDPDWINDPTFASYLKKDDSNAVKPKEGVK